MPEGRRRPQQRTYGGRDCVQPWEGSGRVGRILKSDGGDVKRKLPCQHLRNGKTSFYNDRRMRSDVMDSDARRFGKRIMNSVMNSLINRVVWRMPLGIALLLLA